MQLTRSSNPIAQAKGWELLELPDFPEGLRFLWGVFQQLHFMRDSDMNGWKRFAPSHIKDGCSLFGWTLEVREVEAIVMLDIATLHPGEPKK